MNGWEDRLASAFAARDVRKLQALAVELGVDESAVSRWRRGRSISLENVARLCLALDVSMDWLVLGRGDMNLHHADTSPAPASARVPDDTPPDWFLPDLPAERRIDGYHALRRLLHLATTAG